MKIHLLFLTLFILLIFLIPQNIHPCTTFCLDKGNQLVVGFNFDSIVSNGLIIVNKRGVSKTALPVPIEKEANPARWTSKYGSVTLNLLGREFPLGGVNEAGLVVQMMALLETEYPAPDSRPYVNGFQWIQYQLDNFSKVEQVIASDSGLRISKPTTEFFNLHFLISDRMGNCTSIEYINGKLVHHTKETMPVKVLTNSAYAESITFFHDEQSGSLPIGQGNNSLFRFVRAAEMLKSYNPRSSKSVVDFAFDILSNVRATGGFYLWGEPLYTQWSVVYDLQNFNIHFHTLENKKTRYINLSSFDFSCKKPVNIFDINTNLSGDVTKNFIQYNYNINRDLLKQIPTPLQDEKLDDIPHYPESTVCMDK